MKISAGAFPPVVFNSQLGAGGAEWAPTIER
jgi:hypothetical protein